MSDFAYETTATLETLRQSTTRAMGKRKNVNHEAKDPISAAQRKDELRRAAAKPAYQAPAANSGNDQAETKESKPLFDPKAVAEKYGWTYTEQAQSASDGKAWIVTHIQVTPPLGAKIDSFAFAATEDVLKTLMTTSIPRKCTRMAHKTAMIATALMRGAQNVEGVRFVEAAITKAMNESIQECIEARDRNSLPTEYFLASQEVDPTGQTLLPLGRE